MALRGIGYEFFSRDSFLWIYSTFLSKEAILYTVPWPCHYINNVLLYWHNSFGIKEGVTERGNEEAEISSWGLKHVFLWDIIQRSKNYVLRILVIFLNPSQHGIKCTLGLFIIFLCIDIVAKKKKSNPALGCIFQTTDATADMMLLVNWQRELYKWFRWFILLLWAASQFFSEWVLVLPYQEGQHC